MSAVLGSLVSQEGADRVQNLIDEAIAKGAKALSGNTSKGTIMTATVLDRVTPAMRIYSEDSFGPVVCVIRVAGDEEAIRVANEGEYGSRLRSSPRTSSVL
jgi:acyl-CoA reductase-like NAD-dependent aldehyde dehydrogenase